MRYLLIYFVFSMLVFASDKINNKDSNSLDLKQTNINYEFPKYDDINTANNMLSRFAMHNENYVMPLYYSISNIRKPYQPYEVKLQISAKINLFDDILFGVGLFLAYTQVSYFQMYSRDISSPFRDNDYIPEVTFYKGLNWKLFGGEFYNIRFGYIHRSNGEEILKRSRGIDRIQSELMYKNGDFNASIKAWFYIGYDPKDITRYIGYSDLKLGYKFLDRNHIIFTIKNLIHNYKNYKGAFMIEYKFDIIKTSIYLQYFQGYGDNIYQYRTKSKNIGIGLAIKR